MAGAVELAVAYVSITPTFKDVKKELEKGLGKDSEETGKKEGEKTGKSFGEGFSGAVDVAIGAAAGLGMADALAGAFLAQLDKASLPNQFAAQFGQAPEQAAESAKIASDLYAANWGESLDSVATSVGTVQRALEQIGKNEDVKVLTTEAEALAKAFGEDVGGVVNAAAQLVKTKMAPTMAAAFDIITVGFQLGASSGQDLVDTLVEYPVQFEALGLSAATSLGLLNQGLTAGARNSDLVADAIKEFSIQAVSGSASAAASFEALGFNAEQMTATFAKGGPDAAAAFDQVLDALRNTQGQADAATIAFGLFGTQSEDLKAALYALDPSAATASDAMQNVDGAAQKLTEAVGDAPKSKIEELSRVLEGSLGKSLQFAVPLLENVLKVLNPIMPILGPLAIAIAAVTIAQWAWNAALAVSPITWIILGIVALVAAVVWLWNNVDGFKQFFVDAWDWILKALQWVWNWIKENWPYLLGSLTGPFGIAAAWIYMHWDAVVDFFKGIWEWIKGIFNDAVAWIVDAIMWFGELPGMFNQWFLDVYLKAKGQIDKLIGFVASIPQRIQDGLSGLGQAFVDAFRWAFNTVADLWNNSLGSWSITIPDWVPGLSGATWSMPNIPHMKHGGVVPRTAGGRLILAGEGTEDEAVTPMSDLKAMMRTAAQSGSADIDYARLAAALAAAFPDITLRVDSREIARANRQGERSLARQG